ncbi:MAG: hypothetical protein AAF871_05355 [Pseudomonadota bacterium]
MIVFLTHGGIVNRSLLTTKSVPRRVLSLGLFLVPRVPPWRGVFWRAIFEHALARYTVALSPFVIVMAIWPRMALPIAEAPLLMFLFVWLFEKYGLSVPSAEARRALILEDEAGRLLDRIRVAGEAQLSRIGADREIETGMLHLVIEQSAYARVPPLTLVSVLLEAEKIEILNLSRDECDALGRALFPEADTERALHRAGLAEGVQIRRFAFDPRTITAHARLAALAKKSDIHLSNNTNSPAAELETP